MAKDKRDDPKPQRNEGTQRDEEPRGKVVILKQDDHKPSKK